MTAFGIFWRVMAFAVAVGGVPIAVGTLLPMNEPPKVKPSTWYVEAVRSGECVSTYLCAMKPERDGLGCWQFTTIEGEHVFTTLPVIIKERKPAK